MSARQIAVDISAFTAGGVDLITLATEATVTKNIMDDAGQAINRLNESPQGVKMNWMLSATALSTKSGAIRVTNLDLSAASILGTDVLAAVESINFDRSLVLSEGSGCGDGWQYPNVTGGGFSGSARIKIPTSGVPLMAGIDAVTDADGVFTFTLNGVSVTLPVLITSIQHSMRVGDVQVLEVTFKGQDPLTGTYPTAPTGTTTLMEKIFNAPRTALAVVLTTKAADGVAYTGNVVPQSYSVAIADGQVVRESFTFQGVGALADVASA